MNTLVPTTQFKIFQGLDHFPLILLRMTNY